MESRDQVEGSRESRYVVEATMLTIATAALCGVLGVASAARADSITFQIDSLSGTIEPFTYTTIDGTFETGPIFLSLNKSLPSLVIVERDTGFLTARTVMDVFFNDGRGSQLSGTASIAESGTIESEFTIISTGILVGAGAFSGTVVKGRNPFKWEYDDPNDPASGAFVIWSSGPPPPPPRFSTVAIDLPATFVNGADIPLSFEIAAHATVVPEPSTRILLSLGTLGLVCHGWRRRKRGIGHYLPRLSRDTESAGRQ
jgi:hypothetical protein